MKVINYGHSCIEISGSISVIFDQYQDGSVPGLKLPLITSNFAFKSHNHHDHNADYRVLKTECNVKPDITEIIVPHDKNNGKDRGMNKIFILNLDGYRIVHMGDIGCVPSYETLKPLENCDILFAPINGFYTISAIELKQIVDMIHPRIVVPMHYYNKENKTGYPDGGQIDIFKKLFPNYLEVNKSFDINDELFNNKVIIFKNAAQ